jgi:hypothetical protein
MSVYDDLCGFVLAHRSCRKTRAYLAPATDQRYRVRLTCSCGSELRRSVTREDAREDLRASASLVAERWTPGAPRRRRVRYGGAGSGADRTSAA